MDLFSGFAHDALRIRRRSTANGKIPGETTVLRCHSSGRSRRRTRRGRENRRCRKSPCGRTEYEFEETNTPAAIHKGFA